MGASFSKTFPASWGSPARSLSQASHSLRCRAPTWLKMVRGAPQFPLQSGAFPASSSEASGFAARMPNVPSTLSARFRWRRPRGHGSGPAGSRRDRGEGRGRRGPSAASGVRAKRSARSVCVCVCWPIRPKPFRRDAGACRVRRARPAGGATARAYPRAWPAKPKTIGSPGFSFRKRRPFDMVVTVSVTESPLRRRNAANAPVERVSTRMNRPPNASR